MNRAFLLTLSVCTLALAGCGTAKPGKAGAANAGGSDKVSRAMASAARDAADGGLTQESLMFQENLYHKDPRNEVNIINYARGLRKAGRIDDALLVVRTPASAQRASSPLLTECSMVLIAAGEYNAALGYAQKAIERDKKSADAIHALALAMSGLEEHSAAQLQFQKALDMWPENRDKTPVINNLAMSLVAQGKVSEARTVMSLATGEALRSRTYQNNRALLESLKDRDVRREKLAAPATQAAPAPKKAKGVHAKMKPIIE